MAMNKKPTSGKKVFTATVTTEKQQDIKIKKGTANMVGKAKTAASKPAKVTGSVGTKWEQMKKMDKPKAKKIVNAVASMNKKVK